jgi:hypothetical protein
MWGAKEECRCRRRGAAASLENFWFQRWDALNNPGEWHKEIPLFVSPSKGPWKVWLLEGREGAKERKCAILC